MDVTSPAASARDLDRELQLVTEAIAFVARGASARVTVAGIAHGADVLAPAGQLAAVAGLRVIPRPSEIPDAVDLTVERRPAIVRDASPEPDRDRKAPAGPGAFLARLRRRSAPGT